MMKREALSRSDSFRRGGEAHVRYAEGNLSAREASKHLELLTREERGRYGRFIVEPPREQFLLGRALLREVLAPYLGLALEEIEFAAGEHGKLALAGAGEGKLEFNLSHTAGLAACVVSRASAVGVDVEAIEPRRAKSSIARTYFAEREFEGLQGLPQEKYAGRFFELWTLKESYIKARGEGMALGLKDFAFEISEEEPKEARVSFGGSLADDPAAWRFHLMRPTERHVLAAAVRRAAGADVTFRVQRIELGGS